MAGDIPRGDHPRIRGEHICDLLHINMFEGSSPHTRGAQRRLSGNRPSSRIIPAYAGSTTDRSSPPPQPPDHPRIRGEHYSPPRNSTTPCGSSPHTRGARRSARGCPATRRIIPAYAGSTAECSGISGHATDHPRIRGEHTHAAAIEATRPGSSPHTRGALGDWLLQFEHGRIIPAYAGSTRRRSPACAPAADHPRIRGEHVSFLRQVSSEAGSSPHTRGARVGDRAPLRGDGIIPAYAGSTRTARRRA